jgi:hypothetical protein
LKDVDASGRGAAARAGIEIDATLGSLERALSSTPAR